MKEQFTTTVAVAGKGESKSRAFADALNQVQSTVLRSTQKIVLRIEPQDLRVISARERIKRERFLFFFLARERRSYSVELEVTVSVTVFDTEKVDFTAVG